MRVLARLHRELKEFDQLRDTALPGDPVSPVLEYADMIRGLGGSYEPFQDWGERPKKITVRRANRGRLYALRMDPNGVEKYRRDKETRVIRRVS